MAEEKGIAPRKRGAIFFVIEREGKSATIEEMKLIDGKNIAKEIIERLKGEPVPQKIFAAVLVGDNAASESFVKQKEKVAKELGIDFRIYRFPESSTNDSLREDIAKLAKLSRVGAMIVQLPLPAQVNAHYVLNAIPSEKDVDVLSERTIGAFYNNRSKILPPSVAVCQELCEKEHIDLGNKKVAVVGLGVLVGKPIAVWLMKKVKEIYALDQGSDLDILKQADIVISGVGKAGLIGSEMIKHGAIVIDFGYSFDDEGKIRGDFDHDELHPEGSFTPTPGGTGPVLIAKLMENFYILNREV
jgi:methylenetetrahydrofolate dehydrogenase (NADP+)/methenyltetrahydrofolate cyclohydrolase